jgi:membrane-bound serine protease (ClpP class)
MSLELTIAILLVVGLAFMALEAVTPAFGLLGLAGAASFIAAVLMLRNLDTFMGYEVDAALMGSLGIVGAVVLVACLYFVRMAWKSKVSSGSEIMVGMIATVLDWHEGRGQVRADGEDWAAHGPRDLKAGDVVKITHRDHLVLTVTKEP